MSNTVQNPKNDDHYLAITRYSGLSTIDPLLHTDEVIINNSTVVDETLDIDSDKATGVDVDNGKGKVDKPTVKKIS